MFAGIKNVAYSGQQKIIYNPIFGQNTCMEYTLIKKTDANGLVSEVNEWINKGWKPIGGVAVAFGRIRNETGSKSWTEVLFHIQAMMKE